jgi:hypothetical protein
MGGTANFAMINRNMTMEIKTQMAKPVLKEKSPPLAR